MCMSAQQGVPELPRRCLQKKKMKWWQQLGQSFNADGIRLFLYILAGHEALAVPHISVPDIRWIDWHALRAVGFKGCVFDKDNTMTEPYILSVHPPLQRSMQQCQEAFSGHLVLLSNSAGLQQFDPDGCSAGTEAAKLETVLGIQVLRHSTKKPAGDVKDLERHFGCSASELIMIGDRYLTDVVYGNRHGLLTIRPAPLAVKGEPQMVQLVRKIEDKLVKRWTRQGLRAPAHSFASDDKLQSFQKEPSPWQD
eukprot:jgi/Astpho2/9759/Aster-03736